MKKHTITSDDAATFDPGKQRVTDLGDNTTQTESGAYINPDTIDDAVSRASTEMPKPVKGK